MAKSFLIFVNVALALLVLVSARFGRETDYDSGIIDGDDWPFPNAPPLDYEPPLDIDKQRPSLQNALDHTQVLYVSDRPGLPFPHNFTTIQQAIDAVPLNNQHRYMIHLEAKTYREKISILPGQEFINLMGRGRNKTIIVWNDTSATPIPGRKGKTYGTSGSATVSIGARYFIARDLTFKNDAPCPDNGQEGGQAVALKLEGDFAAIYDCNIIGFQDTLYDKFGRHYFHNCHIEGTVDFIFGEGHSLYKNCDIQCVTKIYGSITAQKNSNTSIHASGFAFVDSKVYGTGSQVSLGRPWGSNATVVYANTWIDSLIYPQGWDNWGKPEYEKTVLFAEYNTDGPGSYFNHVKERANYSRHLTYFQAERFMTRRYINGDEWLLTLD